MDQLSLEKELRRQGQIMTIWSVRKCGLGPFSPDGVQESCFQVNFPLWLPEAHQPVAVTLQLMCICLILHVSTMKPVQKNPLEPAAPSSPSMSAMSTPFNACCDPPPQKGYAASGPLGGIWTIGETLGPLSSNPGPGAHNGILLVASHPAHSDLCRPWERPS